MIFERALDLMRTGNRVRLSNWPERTYLSISNGVLVLHRAQQKASIYWPSDLLKDNWELIA